MKRIALALALLSLNAVAGENWPEFRGPNGDGKSDAKGVPLTWSETEHVKWKAPVHDKGWSSPVIWGNQVWLTTATEEGKEMFALCFDKTTGKVIHNLKLFTLEAPIDIRKYNSYASPTPVIEEGRIYITFGSAGTACVDTKTGKKIWERTDIKCNHFRGAGSSPILFGNLLILNYDGSDFQFVMAFDKQTGKTAWWTRRSVDYKDVLPDGKIHADGDYRKAFGTAKIAMLEGQPVLLSSGAKAHYAYDPLTGKELWRLEEAGQHSAATRPLAVDGTLYFTTGFAKGQLVAIKPPQKSAWGNCVADLNDATTPDPKRPQVLWSVKKAVANKPSLIFHDGLIFMLTDGGVASCMDAKTGDIIWTERVGGDYSASPVFADGRIYVINVEGKAVVFEAGRQYKVLAENKLPEGSMGSPAISGKALYIRTKSALYRIEN
jgi:outer membrane protein assembly factor BamB